MLLQDLDKAIEQENAKIGGGVGVGAVIGTFIVPWFGTVVGGILGGWIGSLFGPSMDDLKAESTKKLVASVNEAFCECESAAKDIQDRAVAQSAESLCAIIEGYSRVYKRRVDAMIAKDAQMRDKLAGYRKVVQGDLVEIRARYEKLIAIREQLRSR